MIGLGYIGLPTALMLASQGNAVTGTDINNKLIEQLNNEQLTFEEEGLEKVFHLALKHHIQFKDEVVPSDIYIIAVPTPYLYVTKRIDTSYVIKAIDDVLSQALKGSIVVIESTISPGTIDRYIKPHIENSGFKLGQDIHLVHAPERIIPGNMIHELVYNARTIGADSKEIASKVKTVYETFCEAEIVLTDIRSAEMSKVIENTYRDVNIAFANELAKICRSDEMDVYEIIRIANKHPRVNILNPGPGVGGHCISVDPWFLVGDYPDLTNLILSARRVNDSMPHHVLKRIRQIMTLHTIKDISKVGLYGLTYKENVDDVRESPTLQLLKILDEHVSFGIKVYDPFIMNPMVDNQYFALEPFINEVEIVVIMVAHDEIKQHQGLLKEKHILDTKNVITDEIVYKL